MMTRQEYLGFAGTPKSGKAHREYYAQFVDGGVVARVRAGIGARRIRASKDPHLNDIPLGMWDRIFVPVPHRINESMRAQGDYPTIAGMVCIAKEAAHQIVEGATV